ncbi:MAG: gamma-glutamylcyclotransferase family protein [Gimesia sp.]
MSSEIRSLIFVYGTLKRGYCRSHHLTGQMFLGEAVTSPGYLMYDCGEYPGLVVDINDGVSIQGELWSVDEKGISLLDQVEGVAENWFSRESVALIKPTVDQPVQAYYFQGDVTRLSRYGCNWIKRI